ncbi:MAG: hypothetical protein ACRDSK_03385 [Actinophytocola sp.]|uniref:hypothetical protein n=1 Tax=Actinophytocola sp. TaxID=1872138 RepID=UPI003D6B10E6
MSDSHDPADQDPARGFLDQTVPREDYWEDREPDDGPARPRHVQHPTDPQPLPDPRTRRRNAIKSAAWTFGPSVGYLAASAAFAGSAQAEPAPESRPESRSEPEPEPLYDDPSGGFGEVGSGL